MKILNKNGFSMLQVVVAMALAGVLGMFILQMQTVQTKGIKTNELQLERTNVLNRMTSLFAKRDICNLNFKNKKSGDSLTKILQKAGSVVFSVSQDAVPGLLRIDRMGIVTDAGGLLSLEVQFSSPNQMVLGKENTKRVPLQTVLDTDGKIIDCYSDEDNLVQTAMSLTCESMGATYDSANKKCNVVQTAMKLTCESIGATFDASAKKCNLSNLPQCIYTPDAGV